MAYTLQAAVTVAGGILGQLPHHFQLVDLQCGVVMIPLSTRALASHGIPAFLLSEEAGEQIPPPLAKFCEQLSAKCSLAYIEAEHFGGAGTQAHALFSEGNAVGRAVVSDNAINEALRWLGVSRGEAYDEFEAVGLDQHRSTDAWLRRK